MTNPELQITAKDLDLWADRRVAQDQLPRLVRDLVFATRPLPEAIAMVAGEGVQRGGWDGIVRSEGAPPFVPAGTSGWEMSVRLDIARKAQQDYDKRVNDPLGLDPSETTFVFATARDWHDGDDWCKARRAEGVWRDVCLIDANQLEAWLAKAPAVHLRLAHELGRCPPGVADLRSVWMDVRESTTPHFSASLIIAGRGVAADRARELLAAGEDAISVAGDSREEALAFVAAAIEQLPEPEGSGILARAIVVWDPSHWATLAVRDEPLILIPMFEDRKLSGAAMRRGHQLILPLGREEGRGSETAVQIGRPRRHALAEELESLGLPRYRARELAGIGRRSLLALKRQLATARDLEQPDWSQPEHAGDLIPALFAGSWADSNEQDREVLAILARKPYEGWMRVPLRWANESDPPVRLVDHVWLLTSKEDAWPLLRSSVSRDDLDALTAACLEVFSWVDPAHDLPLERQWTAGLFKQEPEVSGALRKGLAHTLALLGSRDTELPGGTGQAWASRIVREILEWADADWRRWATLAPVLQLFAEAAPDTLLDAVERGTRGEDPLLANLFRDQSSSFFGSSPHVELLWALERLAWSAQHLPRAALALARLERIDPFKKSGNRPIGSLTGIFLPHRPHTTAGAEMRKQVLETILERESEVGWRLLVELVPRGTVSFSSTDRPEWRGWAPADDPPRNLPEIIDNVDAVVDLMLTHAGTDPERWASIASILDRLPSATLDKALSALKGLEQDGFNGASPGPVTDGLREIIARHQRHAEGKSAVTGELLDQLRAIYHELEPEDLIERSRWLFNENPAVMDLEAFSWQARRDALEEKRTEVARAIHSERGLEGLIELARRTSRPVDLGVTLGTHELLSEDESFDLLTRGLAAGSELSHVAWGFAREAAHRMGPQWMGQILESPRTREWTDEQKANFLLAPWYKREVWELADRLGGEVPRLYWSNAQLYGLREYELAEEAAKRLLEYGRPYSALVLLSFAIHDQPDPPSWDLAVRALEVAPATDPKDDPVESLQYHLEDLLDRITASGEVTEEKLARIEWIWLALLEDTSRSAAVLHRELGRNPGFFIEVVGLVYAGPDEDEEETEVDATLGYHARRLLGSWRGLPGLQEDGTLDSSALQEWVDRAVAAAEGSVARRGAEYEIGQMLSRAPLGDDGRWPHEAVREVIERLESQALEDSFEIARFNARGATMRMPLDGGEQERALLARYEEDAAALAPRSMRTARVLRRLAETYRNIARSQDTSAELREDMDS